MLQGDWRSAIYGRKLQTNGPRNLVLFAGAIEQANIVQRAGCRCNLSGTLRTP